jgi:hypothetical protein
MPETAMPGLHVGNALSIKGRGGGMRGGLGMGNASIRAVQDIEIAGSRERAADNDFIVFIGDPTVFWSKRDKVVAMPSESVNRD